MRLTKTITINDGDIEYKYELKQMSDIGLHRWAERALCLVAGTGVLGADVGANLEDNIRILAQKVIQNGFSFLGDLNCEKLDELLLELLTKCARRVVGATTIEVTEKDIENTLSDIQSLIELEKECFLINFPQLADESESISPTSPETVKDTLKQGISVTPLRR